MGSSLFLNGEKANIALIFCPHEVMSVWIFDSCEETTSAFLLNNDQDIVMSC